jgi:hypothetical protein
MKVNIQSLSNLESLKAINNEEISPLNSARYIVCILATTKWTSSVGDKTWDKEFGFRVFLWLKA